MNVEKQCKTSIHTHYVYLNDRRLNDLNRNALHNPWSITNVIQKFTKLQEGQAIFENYKVRRSSFDLKDKHYLYDRYVL